MGRVAELGCIICRLMGYDDTPAQVHHMKWETGAAGAGRSDYLTLPLCEPHHTGPDGVHQLKDRGLRLRYKHSELDLLALVLELLEKKR